MFFWFFLAAGCFANVYHWSQSGGDYSTAWCIFSALVGCFAADRADGALRKLLRGEK